MKNYRKMMLVDLSNIPFKPIKRVSPSQFHSMRKCLYKSVLAEAFAHKALLPYSASAYMGSLSHKMLELIIKRKIQTEQDFEKSFADELKKLEKSLKQQGYFFYVPLQINVKDFGLKKILLKKQILTDRSNIESSNVKSEEWYVSRDGLIGGRIDLVISNNSSVQIIDFKTGAITSDSLDDNGEKLQAVKDEYQEQVKLYAFLYFDSTGIFPNSLTLIDLSKNRFDIPFNKDECEQLFIYAKELLQIANISIEKRQFKANPSVENCKYCLYRPACVYFLSFLKDSDSFNDISGIVLRSVKYKNGNVTVYLMRKGNEYSITGFSEDKYHHFEKNINKEIRIFNVKKETVEYLHSVTKATVIYG